MQPESPYCLTHSIRVIETSQSASAVKEFPIKTIAKFRTNISHSPSSVPSCLNILDQGDTFSKRDKMLL
jgi:hypothetical protein